MTQSVIFALGLFAAAVTLVLVANFIVYAMVGEVNRKLSDAEQLKYLVWYPGKLADLKRRYREFYPGSRLILAFNLCVASSALLVLAVAWKLGFFR
jgi:hypothetical protein